MNIGRTGSSDRVIARVGTDGIYLSVRLVRTRGFWLSFGGRYRTGAGLR